MNTLKFIIPAVAAVGMASPALGISPPGPAPGPLNYISQSGNTDAYANALGSSGSDPKSSTGLSDLDLSSQYFAGNSEGDNAFASATLFSTLGASMFSYSGSVNAEAYEGGFGELSFPIASSNFEFGESSASASSIYSVTFNVSSPIGFTFSGSSSGGGFGQVPQIARMQDSEAPIRFFGGDFNESWDVGEDFELTGLLVPGEEYTFAVDLYADAFASSFPNFAPLRSISPLGGGVGNSGGSSGIFTFSTTTEVPETGTVMAGVMLVGLAAWQWRRRQA